MKTSTALFVALFALACSGHPFMALFLLVICE
jgi:hypothetical protein